MGHQNKTLQVNLVFLVHGKPINKPPVNEIEGEIFVLLIGTS